MLEGCGQPEEEVMQSGLWASGKAASRLESSRLFWSPDEKEEVDQVE